MRLGLVRTGELLAAGRYYGVDQYWTRVIDYGFSKTMAESIEHWTRERVLGDVVRVVRTVRPLVVTSVFVGGPSDGHGNHQTAGAMAQAVFKAAADPNMFPEQIRAGLRPWTPVKDYARVPFSARGGDSPPAANVEVEEGVYDPMLAASYVQLSREGLGHQKSQNGGPNIPKAGEVSSAYHRYGSTVQVPEKEKDFFEGIDTSLMGLAGLAKGGDAGFLQEGLRKVNAAVEDAIAKFSATAPDRCAPALAQGMKATAALISSVQGSGLTEDSKYDLLHELNIKRAPSSTARWPRRWALVSPPPWLPIRSPTHGWRNFSATRRPFASRSPRQTFGVKVHAVNQSSTAVQLISLSVESTHWAEVDRNTCRRASTFGQRAFQTHRRQVYGQRT